MQEQTTTARAVLTFTDGAARASFSVPRARQDLAAAEARDAMLTMIGTGALRLRQLGDVTGAKAAKLVTTTRTRVI